MTGLLDKLSALPQLQELLAALHSSAVTCCAAVTGLAPVHRAMFSAALAAETKRPLLLLCADEKDVQRQAADIRVLLGVEPVCLPERELQLRPAAYSRQWENARLSALYRMARGDAPVVVTTAAALVQRCLSREVLLSAAFSLEVGARYDVQDLCRRLTAAGYTRTDQVEGAGQFALRGGILDVFSPGEERPLRCEFFDDELDSLGEFETATQRRVLNRRQVCILPASELLPFAEETTAADAAGRMEDAARRLKKEHAAIRQRLLDDAELLRQGIAPPGADRYMAAVCPDKTTAFDYLAQDTILCAGEAGRVQETLRAFLFQTRQDVTAAVEAGLMAGAFGDLTLTEPELETVLSRFALCQLESLPTSRYLLPPRLLLDVSAKQLSGYGGSLDAAATDITHYLTAGFGVLVLCGGAVRCRNMQEFLQRRHIPAALALEGDTVPAPGQTLVSVGALSAGSEWPALKLAVLTEGQLTRALSGKAKKPRQPKSDSRQRLLSYADLEVGDLVVHIHHGIGRFAGMIRLPVDGVEKDYIKIQYAGSDCLYVPATSLDLVSKYIGGGDDTEKVKLNKLSGDQWTKTTRRAKAAAKDLADGLIKLYAQRQRLGGHAFSPDTPWQQEFEEAFDYTETDDQLTAIREIKADMEKPVPMDRLLCGDVGYGKTEVSLRAAFKALMDSKQVAILAPTTILAQQHYNTVLKRFKGFPVKVDVLSRFRTAKETKDVLRRVKEGEIDILVGTHRILGKDVQFKNLGLLIVDEEQRFGVQHKEIIKNMKHQVDVLTLSATPIPRTLHMSMVGIRDMSVLETPPEERLPVQTRVIDYNDGVIRDAILREVSRGGQVYFLYNSVQTIGAFYERLKQLVPEARIGVAHGQMREHGLEDVMMDFYGGSYDVLLCTTIIESGLDVPTANTLIVFDADRFGLSQLYQLRGRVGRSNRQAYAYFTIRPERSLSETAEKRLEAIREFTEFGAGFRIAMRDLEIRGAGNILGPEQHGHLATVGYDMYCKLMEETLQEARAEQEGLPPAKPHLETRVDIKVDAYLPDDYVHDDRQRMEMYKRIASLTTQADREDITDELLDRFGEVPPVVETLLDVAQVRVLANQLGVSLVTYKRGGFLVMKLNAEYMPDQAAFIPAMAMTDKRLMPSTTAPDVLLLVDPTLGEYAMLSEAVKVLGKLNENIETMLKKQKKGEKHENT